MTTSMAIYSMPAASHFYQVTGPSRTITTEEIFQESGFVFAPFDPSNHDIYHIAGQPEEVELKSLHQPDWKLARRSVEGDDWYSYLNMFHDSMEAILSGRCEKIVLSLRDIETLPIRSVTSFLWHLRKAYADAFVYLFYLPGKELWMGASPELLLDTESSRQRTVALAGTLKDAPEWEDWPEKERKEHHYVERFVEEILEGRTYQKVGPQPIPAGPVYHLHSNYTIDNKENQTWQQVDPFRLHPGPALSGFPVYPSIEEIKRIERSPRRYYTGFLGPVWSPERSTMYINLRCLEMLEDYNVLYAGGGLTSESDPEKEWMEIQYKLSTLRSKIHKGQKIP